MAYEYQLEGKHSVGLSPYKAPGAPKAWRRLKAMGLLEGTPNLTFYFSCKGHDFPGEEPNTFRVLSFAL